MEPSHQLSAHLQFQFHILRSVQDSRFTLRRPESPFIRYQFSPIFIPCKFMTSFTACLRLILTNPTVNISNFNIYS
ncbi:hypothetical protein Hanom_Chr16g01460531 [Helianthus anomalus]